MDFFSHFGGGIIQLYQPMPSTEANSFLDDALKPHKHRLGAVVSGDHHLGVAGQDGELLLGAVAAAVKLRRVRRESAIAHHCCSFQHFWRFLHRIRGGDDLNFSWALLGNGMRPDGEIIHWLIQLCAVFVDKGCWQFGENLGLLWREKTQCDWRWRNWWEREREGVYVCVFLLLFWLTLIIMWEGGGGLWIPRSCDGPVRMRHVSGVACQSCSGVVLRHDATKYQLDKGLTVWLHAFSTWLNCPSQTTNFFSFFISFSFLLKQDFYFKHSNNMFWPPSSQMYDKIINTNVYIGSGSGRNSSIYGN